METTVNQLTIATTRTEEAAILMLRVSTLDQDRSGFILEGAR